MKKIKRSDIFRKEPTHLGFHVIRCEGKPLTEDIWPILKERLEIDDAGVTKDENGNPIMFDFGFDEIKKPED